MTRKTSTYILFIFPIILAIVFAFRIDSIMPALSAIRAANAAFKHSLSPVPTAVFVGGTSGIGQGMAEAFARYTAGHSDIVIVGRNRAAAEKILSTMPSPNSGKFVREFVQCDASLMKNVHATTQDLLARYPKINYLVMSPGIMTLSGRDETEEGIDKKLAVHYYARWKFLHDLLPALTKAKAAGEEGAVMSVLGAGYGGAIDVEDLAMEKGYSTLRVAAVAPTYNDLMMEAPTLSLIHASPGGVRTSIMSSSPSALLRIGSAVLPFFLRPFMVSADECAEWMWHAVYSTAAEPGTYRTDSHGEDIGKKRYVGDEEQRRKLWEHTEGLLNSIIGRA
ncbi:hypothetical protein NLJ89_g2358 [Agrocybe chaxingu]|uniref:NAD(P)-binding protein n=1 Tax=Agrocybe chaxingu TaxID=84603 RepID=A0A9W8K4J7_9AGAR|nr:hypothetical protein NLJ89_g2358 [Agrocybe chaxingu]